MLRILLLVTLWSVSLYAEAVIQSIDFYDSIEAETIVNGVSTPIPGCKLHLVQYWDTTKQPIDGNGYHQMIIIHGGGFESADYSVYLPSVDVINQNVGDYLNNPIIYFVENGFLVTTIDYRALYGPNSTNDPYYVAQKTQNNSACGTTTTADLKRDVYNEIVTAIVTNAFGWNGQSVRDIGTERAIIYGISAGAHLAVWAANELSQDDRKKVAIVADSAPLDFMDIWLQATAKNNRYGGESTSYLGSRFTYNSMYGGRLLNIGGKTSFGADGKIIAGYDPSSLAIEAFNTWAYSAIAGHDLSTIDFNSPAFTNAFANLTPDTSLDGAENGIVRAEDGSAAVSVLLDNSFRLNTLKTEKGAIPPTYLLVGAQDGFVPPEQSIIYCEGLGYPVINENTLDHVSFNCTGAASDPTYALDVVLDSNHVAGQSSAVFDRIAAWFSNPQIKTSAQ